MEKKNLKKNTFEMKVETIKNELQSTTLSSMTSTMFPLSPSYTKFRTSHQALNANNLVNFWCIYFIYSFRIGLAMIRTPIEYIIFLSKTFPSGFFSFIG